MSDFILKILLYYLFFFGLDFSKFSSHFRPKFPSTVWIISNMFLEAGEMALLLRALLLFGELEFSSSDPHDRWLQIQGLWHSLLTSIYNRHVHGAYTFLFMNKNHNRKSKCFLGIRGISFSYTLLFSSLPSPFSLFLLPSHSPLPLTEDRDFLCWDDLSISECGYWSHLILLCLG